MKRLATLDWYRRNGVLVGNVLLVVIAAASLGGWYDNSRADVARAEKTHAAICALRSDLVQRIASGNRFLHQHPNGVSLGKDGKITPADIQRSIKQQQRTVDALAVADCHATH